MSRPWIVSLLFARKLIIASATLASLLGGVAMIAVSNPRYLATARVTVDYVKPDPITGAYLTNKTVDAYVTDKITMVRRNEVLIPAVEALGWLDDPGFAAAFANDPKLAGRDYREWVAGTLQAGVSGTIVPGSNILEIGFRGSSPEEARAIVEAIRNAYISTNIVQRRQAATADAENATARVKRLSADLLKIEKTKRDYSKSVGIILEDDADDPENRNLQRLAKDLDDEVVEKFVGRNLRSEELVRLETAVAQAETTMGANNPTLAAMRRNRDALRAQVTASGNSKRNAVVNLAERDRFRAQRIESQKQLVLGRREDVLQLRVYQDEVDRLRKQLNTEARRLQDARQLASLDNGGVTAVGESTAEERPVFPNIPLIVISSTVLGLLFGAFSALLVELLHRRVRSARDLELAAPVPILGMVPYVKPARSPWLQRIQAGHNAKRRRSLGPAAA